MAMGDGSGPKVAVVCGGTSQEAPVSRASGRHVARALAQRLSAVVTIEHGPDLGERLRAERVDVVFLVMHGPPGEDGTLQGFLETIEVPYVGSGVLASAVAMHKPLAKTVFRAHGLPVAREVVVEPGQQHGPVVERVTATLGFPVVVKPADQGSAIGVEFVHTENDLTALLARDDGSTGLLVEEWVEGRELTVGLLERDALETLPVVEITTPKGSWYDYEHRYTPGLSEHLVPAPLDDALTDRCDQVARQAHLALGCRDLSRADLLLTRDGPVLLEVNTLPGLTPTSLYPDAGRAVGIEFPDLVAGLARRALARGHHPVGG